MTKWSDWWQCENLYYINYPASDSDELINLCWYCWGGGLYPSRRFAGVELVWKIDNLCPAVGYTVHYIWSDLLLDKYLIYHQTNQFSLQYLHQQRKNLHSCFDSSIFYLHTQISSVSLCLLSYDLLPLYLFVERLHLFNFSILLYM